MYLPAPTNVPYALPNTGPFQPPEPTPEGEETQATVDIIAARMQALTTRPALDEVLSQAGDKLLLLACDLAESRIAILQGSWACHL